MSCYVKDSRLQYRSAQRTALRLVKHFYLTLSAFTHSSPRYTTKNFFAMVSAEFHPVKEEYTFEEVLATVQDAPRQALLSYIVCIYS